MQMCQSTQPRFSCGEKKFTIHYPRSHLQLQSRRRHRGEFASPEGGRGGEWRGMHMMEAGGIRCSLSHSPARAVSDGARCWENLFTCSRSRCFRIVRGDKDDPFSFLFFFSFSNACLTCWWLDDKVGSSAEAVQYYRYYMQMFSNDLIGQCRRL